MSDNEAVLRLLKLRGPVGVTPIEALREVGTFGLAARVYDLRRAGHLIDQQRYKTPGGSVVARYVLVKEAA
jgi:hypothetical protein